MLTCAGPILALPSGLKLLQVYTDFLKYLISETRRHLSDVTGSDPWPSVEDRVDILLTHPNRWGNQEQQFLEQAVVAAGIMPLDGALSRLKFAEESEAAVSFCLPTAAISPKITVRAIIFVHYFFYAFSILARASSRRERGSSYATLVGPLRMSRHIKSRGQQRELHF